MDLALMLFRLMAYKTIWFVHRHGTSRLRQHVDFCNNTNFAKLRDAVSELRDAVSELRDAVAKLRNDDANQTRPSR